MLQRATSTSGFLDFCAVNLANNRHTFKRFYVTYLIRFKLLIRFKFLQVKQVVDLSQVYGEVRLEAKRGLVSPDYSTTRVFTTGKWLFKLRWNDSENVATVSVSHSLIDFHALLSTLNRFKFWCESIQAILSSILTSSSDQKQRQLIQLSYKLSSTDSWFWL